MSKTPKGVKEQEEKSSLVKLINKRTSILFFLLVILVLGYVLTSFLSLKLEESESQTEQNQGIEDLEVSESTITRESYIRPDYATLDFYTSLQSLGYEMNFLFEDLKDYYAKGDASGKTLDDLKADRHLIVSSLDTVVEKDTTSNNSVLVGESVLLLYNFDEAIHNLDQIIHLMENNKKELTTYHYNQAKDKIMSFEQVVEYLLFLQAEEAKDKELVKEKGDSN